MSESEPFNAELRQALVQLIADQTGLEIRERDYRALSEKIRSRMKTLQLNSPEDYYQLLKSSTLDGREEWKTLMTLITNNESYFFRDKEQFSLLRKHILPELIERNKTNKTLRLCSAGCSSGEEPYSLAILLQELIPDLEQWNLTILGIDINQSALQKAREGIYSPWSFRSVDPEIKQRYFKLVDDLYYLDQNIKRMVDFQPFNLIEGPFSYPNFEMKEIDLILCRNVFIYFGAAAIAKAIARFSYALKPQGYLITGHAELSGQDLSLFQVKVFSESLVYQRKVTEITNSSPVTLLKRSTNITVEDLPLDLDVNSLETALRDNDAKMKKVSLDLLKQMPHDTRIERLGNLTIAELILQIETELEVTKETT